MNFWKSKKEIPPAEPPKKEPIPFDLDTRVTRLETRIHELYTYLLETDKYTGKKKLTKAGQSVKRLLH